MRLLEIRKGLGSGSETKRAVLVEISRKFFKWRANQNGKASSAGQVDQGR